ncbi:putative 40S ribosomal protein S11 [Trypanosoma cruzi]|uniref:40S ribosomal protein S11, putative n=3 Tax=Trypanosoma cruzi TaxID=5693 RepID=Q4D0U7_TRYCC|nr:40S ribosomal protein S11, putative [Trypanosoma cruzi]XP_809620.1 40S ribosomal protein S11, putative [Trypanosoma cruzi]5OPT_X Chain X, 40S ribosomal protein S11, putative [Trypanosoma cruzi strain CL Brener]7ASE_X Chain X, 40S ribosomal protein S11, putative [Trypanosoma cruzi]ESS63928.1 40S ribosomal protein S11 [Trypanosoma cruzi Dm28c]PBJ78022.1 40S ribosomal protein S11 [Trypanosoma cruzi cruzi]EAN86153.1 40S ribosomal protein S11, putative [Trypanosoma cruzi]EAN87769.1 40S ribosom|eukprot:XP_808004.1 40S ribosomal protein S11 [Trypanosoma cruzi strain CL Brener]
MTAPEQYARVHSVDLTLQHEKAYQRQTAVNENSHNPNKKHVNMSGHIRYSKKIGLGFKTPKSAINGKYIDRKCPFTSDVSIRGRILRGVVHSTKMKRSIVIRRDYLHFIRKYQRYQKRHRSLTVHCSPCFDPKPGDEVIVGQCRPLSKTIRYNVLEVVSKSAPGKLGRKFSKN